MDRVDEDVVDGLRNKRYISAHHPDGLVSHPQASYPVGSPGKLLVVVVELLPELDEEEEEEDTVTVMVTVTEQRGSGIAGETGELDGPQPGSVKVGVA